MDKKDHQELIKTQSDKDMGKVQSKKKKKIKKTCKKQNKTQIGFCCAFEKHELPKLHKNAEI